MHLDDRHAAELISQSLDRPLSSDEAELLDAYLANAADGQKYARMLRLQQRLASEMMHAAEDGDHVVSDQLPEEARTRIEQMLADASRQTTPASKSGARPQFASASRGQRDLAFASVLLESKRFSADQLSVATKGWRASESGLSDYLVESGVISGDARDILESRVDIELSDTAAGFGRDTVRSARPPGRWSIHRSGVSAQLSQILGMQSDKPEFLDVECRFQLLRQIGEGGLGSVWLARDERLNRNVAVKRLHADGEQSPHAIARFRREAEITGHLEHLNIIPVYLAGTDASSDKDLYVMRFVGKRTLADAIRDYHGGVSPIQEKDSARLYRLLGMFLRVCDAIAYAHSRGVIHRDLKPDNVALDSFGQVIVLDWGLAKVTDDGELGPHLALGAAASDSAVLQTMAGTVIGTPLYMSPEQAVGDLDSMDHRTDIYGLGAILFAILTGRAPHENSAIIVDGGIQIDELVIAIAEHESPSPRELNPDISVDLEAICNKALAFNRHGRHESVAQLSEEIVAWLAGTHERQERYDALRTQGRELISVLANCFRDLGNNARFMGSLPPIQNIVRAGEADDKEQFTVWRERLTTIFRGLLQANSDLTGVTYQQVSDDVRDLVRVERHSTDDSKVRAVPRSRLTQTSGTFAFEVQKQAPDEAVSAISTREVRNGRIAAYLETGISIFDDQTEEPFGNVIIEASLERLLVDFLNSEPGVATEVILCDVELSTLFHWKSQSTLPHSTGSRVTDVAPDWTDHLASVDILSIKSEWTDEANCQFHIRRLIANTFDHGAAFVLIRS
jgi:serine/threonine protein kinase